MYLIMQYYDDCTHKSDSIKRSATKAITQYMIFVSNRKKITKNASPKPAANNALICGSHLPVIYSNIRNLLQSTRKLVTHKSKINTTNYEATESEINIPKARIQSTTPELIHRRAASSKPLQLYTKIINLGGALRNADYTEKIKKSESMLRKKTVSIFPSDYNVIDGSESKKEKLKYRMKSPYRFIKEAEITTKYINPFDVDEEFNKKINMYRYGTSQNITRKCYSKCE